MIKPPYKVLYLRHFKGTCNNCVTYGNNTIDFTKALNKNYYRHKNIGRQNIEYIFKNNNHDITGESVHATLQRNSKYLQMARQSIYDTKFP